MRKYNQLIIVILLFISLGCFDIDKQNNVPISFNINDNRYFSNSSKQLYINSFEGKWFILDYNFYLVTNYNCLSIIYSKSYNFTNNIKYDYRDYFDVFVIDIELENKSLEKISKQIEKLLNTASYYKNIKPKSPQINSLKTILIELFYILDRDIP
ncbi:MAG: hypothetical protein MJ211_00600 [Bacteroidales bacterium]|nr:hypothetical protein [Bacteroidales bacterium]